MKRLLFCAALAAASWPCLAGAQESVPDPAPTAAATPADPQDELYRAALRALADGRTEEAAAMLRRVLVLEPRHAGAWMDLAISECELGNAAEADRLFGELQHRFALPPGMLEAVARYRATGCGKPAAREGSVWLLAATRGHDDNVNQGASDPRFTIGTGSTQTEYELDPAFLPRADSFSQLAVSWLRPLGNTGTNAIVQAYSRWHDEVREQDTASVLGALEHTWKPGGWLLRGTAALGYVTLDRTLYQRQQQLQARITPPWKLPAGADFALSANVSRVDYPTRPAYDGNTVELGGIAGYRTRRSLTQLTLTRLHDDSSDDRPGGDRDGWFGSVQWVGEAAENVTLEAGATRQRWHSKTLYSPGLIETRRLQNTTTLRTAANWQLRPHTTLVLEWRATLNRENISLFQYNSHALQLSLRWDNF
ncbi:tetratricopeptide repeat protein [Massilia sp. YIM B02763]|uniref:tetratricopeptide repeat protein n=1 Tax=Massilia sp. YIM B02763 TaxID=3050130 RepID=UPI0025B65156|nr:tetratricopeptide repeat protein [Massilia sp. YIM B02763]MDN4054642.1 tetratricopeptide repeat protein [Massilia sp. YIM B02763]